MGEGTGWEGGRTRGRAGLDTASAEVSVGEWQVDDESDLIAPLPFVWPFCAGSVPLCLVLVAGYGGRAGLDWEGGLVDSGRLGPEADLGVVFGPAHTCTTSSVAPAEEGEAEERLGLHGLLYVSACIIGGSSDPGVVAEGDAVDEGAEEGEPLAGRSTKGVETELDE